MHEIPVAHRCTRCGLRYRQARGLCRHCEKAAGDTSTGREREAVKVIAQREALARVTPDRPPREAKTITVNGQEFEIMFDGT